MARPDQHLGDRQAQDLPHDHIGWQVRHQPLEAIRLLSALVAALALVDENELLAVNLKVVGHKRDDWNWEVAVFSTG